jgi:transcriptional regulator with XRE-family HTH domain
MLVNERIRAIRTHHRLEGRELARLAGISAGEVSHLERNRRTPRVDTLQKIAAALDVTTGFLLGEEDDDLPLAEALSRQSLKVLLRQRKPTVPEMDFMKRVLHEGSAPVTLKGWRDLLVNVRLVTR